MDVSGMPSFLGGSVNSGIECGWYAGAVYRSLFDDARRPMYDEKGLEI